MNSGSTTAGIAVRLFDAASTHDASFAKHDMTADQFVLLATLARGDALTQRELAQRMSSDPSTVRAMLVLLEKKGIVRRDPHPSDSRARTVALTTMGKRKFQQLGKPARRRASRWRHRFTR